MKKLLAIAAVTLAGCAGQIANPNVTDIDRSASVPVKDLRPVTESKAETFSLLISSDAYATYRVADDSITPAGTILLRHRAYEKFGANSQPPVIQVHHFVAYRNFQSELRRGAIGAALGGAIGAVAAGQLPTTVPGASCTSVDRTAFDSLVSDEFKRALYTEQENPGHASVHIVYIDTEINGKRVFTRTLMPLKTEESGNPYVLALEAAVSCQLSQY